jgi:hypothetical protein
LGLVRGRPIDAIGVIDAIHVIDVVGTKSGTPTESKVQSIPVLSVLFCQLCDSVHAKYMAWLAPGTGEKRDGNLHFHGPTTYLSRVFFSPRVLSPMLCPSPGRFRVACPCHGRRRLANRCSVGRTHPNSSRSGSLKGETLERHPNRLGSLSDIVQSGKVASERGTVASVVCIRS